MNGVKRSRDEMEAGAISPEMEALVARRVEAALESAISQHRYVILTHPSMAHIAEALQRHNPNSYETVNVTWQEFESGMPNIFIDQIQRLQLAHVLLLLNFRDKRILLDQISCLYAIPRYGCKSLTVLLPFYPTGTMERIDREGEIATAATLSRMISATPMTTGGPLKMVIFDIHALQIRFYFQDTILPVLLSAMPLLMNLLEERYSGKSIAVAFPDEGAKKRFGGYFSKAGYPVLFCSKVREGDKRVVRIAEGCAKGHHVFIVDDLCNTGGTVIACREALIQGGASQVSVFVTHGLFPQESWRKFEKSGFEKIFITDSIPETVEIFQKHRAEHGSSSPFEVISIAPALHSYLQGQKQYAALGGCLPPPFASAKYA